MNAKLLGIVLIVVGAGLAIWGYQMSDSLVSEVSEAFTGALPDEVMIRYIAGAACIAVGVFLAARK
jgi:hypothetical protein